MKRILSALVAAVMLVLAMSSLTSCGNGPKYVSMKFAGYGEIVIELDYENAPKTANNFVDLVESGFYDGLLLNRAQEGFVLQGGSPSADSEEPDTIVGEFSSNGYSNNLSHRRGVISMARSDDPNSAASTFFVCLSDSCTQLDGNYAAFGVVVEGMDVVDRIVEAMAPYAYYMGFVYYTEYCVVIEEAKTLKDYSAE